MQPYAIIDRETALPHPRSHLSSSSSSLFSSPHPPFFFLFFFSSSFFRSSVFYVAENENGCK